MQRCLKLINLLIYIVFLNACSTPQIPLPPPEISEFSLEVRIEEKEIRVEGKTNLSGGIITFSDELGNGIFRVINANGEFDTGFFGAADQSILYITLDDSERKSDPVCSKVDYASNSLLHCF